ncbi:MAG: hypothetical protein NVS3B26_16640 [Mycobacteriales bacterium]
MALDGLAGRNAEAAAFGQSAPYAALFSTAPTGGNPGTELTTLNYARQAVTWGAASNGTITGTVPAFLISGGTPIAGSGFFSAVTGGTYISGGTVTAVTPTASGTYTLSVSFTAA